MAIIRKRAIASGKLEKGGRDSNSETFHCNPAGERIPPGRAWPAAGSESCVVEG
jgi:hypothetical protein